MTEPRDRPVTEPRDRRVTETRERTVVTDPAAREPVPVAATVEPTNRPLTWGPIWAGVLTAFGLFFLFGLLAIAGGMALVEFNGQPPGQDVPVDLVASIITGLFLVVAFFAGGFVASWSGWETEDGPGLLNGFLVWALAVLLLLVFAGLGIGPIFGAAGQIFAQLTPGQLPDADPQQLAEAFETAAWQTVFAVVLAMAAAVLGGLVGTRDEFHRRFPYYR